MSNTDGKRNAWQRFAYWFTNIFWYHYKIHVLVFLFVAGLVTNFILTVVNYRVPDCTFVITTTDVVFFDDAKELSDYLNKTMDDQNGDGKSVYTGLKLGLALSDAGFVDSQQKLIMQLQDPTVVLLIMDEETRERYSDYIQPDDDPIDLSQTALFVKSGMDDRPYYACYRVMTADSSEADYRIARAVVQALVNAP